MQPQSAHRSGTILSKQWDTVPLHTPGDPGALLQSGGEEGKEGSSASIPQKWNILLLSFQYLDCF